MGAAFGAIHDTRVAVEAGRKAEMPSRPWPDQNNPMLGYLVNRAQELLDTDGPEAALVWLAVHAWFEGALGERFERLRYSTA